MELQLRSTLFHWSTRMMATGSALYTNPDDYRAGIRGASLDLVLAGHGDFKARLTWVGLPDLHLYRAQENVQRIAYVSLEPARTFVSFPMTAPLPSVWNGVELELGDIVLHSHGEHAHQWTKGPSQWALVSLPLGQLPHYCKVLAELDLIEQPVGRILRPPRGVVLQLRRLHSKACRIAQTKPEIFIHREAARAVEQELILALVECVSTAGAGQPLGIRQPHADIMTRFENALRMDLEKQPSLSELCAMIGVPERTLRECCARFLGVSPGQYVRLKRLNLVRSELRRADPATTSVAQIARRYRFSELGRFAAVYRRIFGEFPSTTLTSK
jgi:AraC-like DNA-binding protein